DLRDAGYAIYVPSANGLRKITGVGTATGTWTAQEVPAGTFVLRYGATMLVTDQSQIDLGYDKSRRPRPQLITHAGTLVTLTASGLQAWQEKDTLDVTSVNSGYMLWWPDLGAPPDAGDTVHRFDFDYLAAYDSIQGDGVPAPRIDATAGDRTYV